MEGDQNIVHYGLDDCEECFGEGVVPCPDCDPSGVIYCNTCDDHGVVPCSDCSGTGRENAGFPNREYQKAYEMMLRPMGFVERLSRQTDKLRDILATQRTGTPTSRRRYGK
jgi:hypothetical protein